MTRCSSGTLSATPRVLPSHRGWVVAPRGRGWPHPARRTPPLRPRPRPSTASPTVCGRAIGTACQTPRPGTAAVSSGTGCAQHLPSAYAICCIPLFRNHVLTQPLSTKSEAARNTSNDTNVCSRHHGITAERAKSSPTLCGPAAVAVAPPTLPKQSAQGKPLDSGAASVHAKIWELSPDCVPGGLWKLFHDCQGTIWGCLELCARWWTGTQRGTATKSTARATSNEQEREVCVRIWILGWRAVQKVIQRQRCQPHDPAAALEHMRA